MKFSDLEEIKSSCTELGVSCVEFQSPHATHFIEAAFSKFKPFKTTGHLQIGGNCKSLALDPHEFTYSKLLDGRPIGVVLDQNRHRDGTIQLPDNRRLCDVFNNAYGIEYFAIDMDLRFMFAVNWYVIQFADPEGTLASLGFPR